MPSVQRFFSGRDNLARTAALAASSVRASTAVERIGATRAGGGRVRLAGSYTGHEATQIEVEIATGGSSRRASVPQFSGVGNGRLEVQAVDGAAALQGFTFTLADLGVDTTHAALDVREVRLVAKVAGAAGNDIQITVAPRLVRTPTAWALLTDWKAGEPVKTGPEWDFGGRPLNAKSELDAGSPRIQFGYDPQVYRPWRRFKNGEWQYGVSPELERDVEARTAVYQVSGGYVITVSDGVTTETFGDTEALPLPQPAIATFYDLLTALAGSALVEVAGVVVADRTVGGQAAVDVPLRTSAWLLSVGGKARLADLGVPANAPTQSISVKCVNADTVGVEEWSVTGDVSGEMPRARTGVLYEEDEIVFRVPRALGAQATGSWVSKVTLATRAEGAGTPAICLRPVALGVNAKPKTVSFEYRKRPPADCNCKTMPTPRLRLDCLGLGTGANMALDPEYQARLKLLYEWRSDFMKSNTEISPSERFARRDMDFADMAIDSFAAALAEIFNSADARDEWDVALQDLQDDVAWMSGLNNTARPPWILINKWQGGLAGHAWFNAHHKKWFVARDISFAGGGGGTHEIGPGDMGWVPPDDASWLTDGTLVEQTYEVWSDIGNNDTMTVVYQCLTEMEVADLARGLSEEQIAADNQALTQLARRYNARMDYCRTLAGIVPKGDSSSGDAGGCWKDHDDAFWWIDTDGEYLPAFTNRAYISAKIDPKTGKPASTKEFGFGLVVACPDRLVVGDTVTLTIQSVDGERPYAVGDEIVIQTVAARPAWLLGGVDGTDEQTWRVTGSASGPLADYVVPTDGSPIAAWSGAGLDVRLAPGGIAFALGDTFSLAVEAGQFKWRRDGGVWSADTAIPAAGPAALADGLALHFDAGATPSFVPGDAYSFLVHQPWAASHVRDAQATQWGWAGTGATMTVDLGSIQPLQALALARYTLPDGATVQAELSDDGVTWGAPLALDVSGAVCVELLAPGSAARHVRLTVAGAAGGALGWLWLGVPRATEHHASSCQRRRRWAVRRGDALNAAALYSGAGDGWRVEWQQALRETDLDALVQMVDWAQQHDEPLVLLPHHLHPQDAALVRCTDDALEVSDVHEYQPDDAGQRLLSASLELDPVFA